MANERPKMKYWDAPDGLWYTQRSVEDEHSREFRKHLRSVNQNYVNSWVLWTDEEKAEWEQTWLTEPEGE